MVASSDRGFTREGSILARVDTPYVVFEAPGDTEQRHYGGLRECAVGINAVNGAS
jgi:hypothetical protein